MIRAANQSAFECVMENAPASYILAKKKKKKYTSEWEHELETARQSRLT